MVLKEQGMLTPFCHVTIKWRCFTLGNGSGSSPFRFRIPHDENKKIKTIRNIHQLDLNILKNLRLLRSQFHSEENCQDHCVLLRHKREDMCNLTLSRCAFEDSSNKFMNGQRGNRKLGYEGHRTCCSKCINSSHFYS